MRNFTAPIMIAVLVLGLVDGAFGDRPLINGQIPVSAILSGLTQIFLVFLWVRLDAQRRNYRRSRLFMMAVVGCSLLALPYYLFRTRGFVKGCMAIVAIVGIVLGYGMTLMIGLLIRHAMRT